MRRLSFRRLLLATLVLSVLSVVGLVTYQIGNYYEHLDAYSGHIVRHDQSAARDGLKDLQYFYDLNRRLDFVRLSWVGEKYIFGDMSCQRAAFYNLDRNFGQTVEELKDKEGFCASFLLANAMWRQAQAIYANALTLPEKTPAEKADKEKQMQIADDMASTVIKDYYEAALKAGYPHHPSSWNYDMMGNAQARARGLRPKPGVIYSRLGEGPGGGGFNPGPKGEESEKGKGDKSKDIDTKEEGPGRPGGRPRKVG